MKFSLTKYIHQQLGWASPAINFAQIREIRELKQTLRGIRGDLSRAKTLANECAEAVRNATKPMTIRTVSDLDALIRQTLPAGMSFESALAQLEGVRDMKAVPRDGTVIAVRFWELFRYQLYKSNSQQAQRYKLKGRWQKCDEYSHWNNCADPTGKDAMADGWKPSEVRNAEAPQ